MFCQERGTVKVALEGILMALYAWNLAPIPGTDLSRSLVVVGREFHFPIDFSAKKHYELTSDPKKINTFAHQQATLLLASREIAKILVQEHRALHREFVNARRPDPRLFAIGDKVFARRSVQSSRVHVRVAKIEYVHTGPWTVTASLEGSSYEITHDQSKKGEKRSAIHLSPCPEGLIPFEPIDGADTRYSQLHRPLQKDAYELAGIKGYIPPVPWKTAATALIMVAMPDDYFPFPSLA